MVNEHIMKVVTISIMNINFGHITVDSYNGDNDLWILCLILWAWDLMPELQYWLITAWLIATDSHLSEYGLSSSLN